MCVAVFECSEGTLEGKMALKVSWLPSVSRK